MSSWLGGLGSGLGHSLGQVGGSLSSFTGQISNFTKDMLLEGVEEVGDTVTELQVSNSKLTEVEAAFTAQKYEFDRLKKLQAEVEEKLEASELQVKRQSAEYRTLLQQKDVELNHLKTRQIGLQEELQKLQRSAQSSSSHSLLPITSSSTTTTTDPVSSFLPRSANSCHSFQGDDMDLSDAIWSQHEINRLSAEVVRLEAEAAHWRQISQASTAGGVAASNAAEILKLQRTIKELREEMSLGVEDHQHELAALQDAQHQKMSDLSRRHREELGEYEERIEELEEQIHSGGTSAAAANTSRLLELQQSVQLLQQEKDDAQEENAALLLNYTRLQASVAELQSRVQEQEGRALQKAQLEQQIQQLKENLTAAEQEVQRLKKQKEQELKEDVEHADILELNTIITTLKQDKASLHQERLEMEQRLREAIQLQVISSGDGNYSADLETVEDLKGELQRGKDALRATQEERDTLMSELEELDQQNQQATQHLISVKEHLSGQLKKAELELFRLTAENSNIKDCNGKLQQELNNHQEKLSQSDFMLNELHMSLRERKDKLELSEEHNKEVCRETVRLKKMLQDKDEQLAAVKEELELSKRGAANEALQQSHLRGAEELLQQSQMRGAEEPLLDLQRELEEMGRTQERLLAEDFDLKIENQKLKEKHQEKDSQASLSRVVREKDTCIEALKLQKQQLQDELQKLEKTLAEQARQYQQTIEELRQASSMDASSLQTEHERIVRLNQDKDLEIAQLKRDLERLVSDHSDTNEMLSITVAGQKQLTDLLQEKDTFMDTFKQNAADLQAEMEIRVSMVTKEAESLRQALEEKERQLGDMKEENSHLKEEMDRVGDQQSRLQPLAEPRTLDIITELETEITELKSSRSGLEEELRTLRRTTEEQQGSLQAQQNELEQANARYQQTTLNYDRLIQARDQDISRLQQTLDRMSPPVIIQEEKTHSLSQENGSEKHDFSKVEIEKLVKGIKEKETEISQLNEKNLSLTRQLDQLVVSRDEVGKLSQLILQKDLEIQALHARVSVGVGSDHSQDVIFLQQQLQAYAVEREQVLAVLNEKTRENSQLRTDYHRLMEILSGKEASLLKLQQENQRLSNMSDSSGSQEMFKETIQNLSRIIREKDIEIDALTQKCQTLVTVLQSSGGESGAESGGVSSNQFEELLQERDTLKQQVKKMEEWKQQVITTVKNMQHESAQLQEELIRLQAQVSTDSDCSSQLSDDYARLIHSYEQKELQLGSLSQELIQVKHTINQLSSTKEVLLGKLGSVASPLATATPIQSTASNNTKLQEILASLRAKLAEREDTIRTLQENNHRLSDCLAVGGEHRDQATKFHQPIERLEALQRSLREKDLLIKTKGDQLGQVSEMLRNRDNDNELLKQAVTNLKERALVLELDVKKLKEDNDLVAARSREKESEFRALQETNMQVSLLLREKEFELSAMRDKAATVEKMLKDKEQGKSGELNQLLNEIKSMQDKAVRFQQERDQVMMALKQKQMETTALHAELQHVRDKEQRSNVELERLRNHLLEIEDSYTREALAGEDREAELRRRAAMLEEKLASSSSAVENASQQASMQVESLQEQLNGAVAQRDDALARLRTSQEQVNQYAVSLSNLQMVLEQFQQEEKAMYTAELEKLTREKEEWRKRSERLQDQTSSLQINLDEANVALDSASRLTDQLDLNEEQIEELKKQVDVRQEMLEEAQKKLMNLLNSTEGKIDKVLMRNLLLGYFHTPKTKRSDVLKLMGSVLGLSRDDLDKMLLEDSGHGVTGWVSSWLGSRAAHSNVLQKPTSVQVLNSSFSEMFVKFLEIESNPTLPAPKLPVQDIKPLSVAHIGRGLTSSTAAVRGGTSRPGAGTAAFSKCSDDSNPFLAPRSAAIPLLTSSGPGSTAGHLLMKPISDALPTFTPVPVSAEASGGTVLKDLLKQ